MVCLTIATQFFATVQVLAESQGATTAVPFDQIDKVRAGSSGVVEFIMLVDLSAYSLQKATCSCVCGTCAQPANVARKHVTREGGGVVPPRFDFNSGPCPPPLNVLHAADCVRSCAGVFCLCVVGSVCCLLQAPEEKARGITISASHGKGGGGCGGWKRYVESNDSGCLAVGGIVCMLLAAAVRLGQEGDLRAGQ